MRPSSTQTNDPGYCGRMAPSPTGYLHVGHVQTFSIASQRARSAQGRLLLRNDDLDRARCRSQYVDAFIEDLDWLGLKWDGPILTQSSRVVRYRQILTVLHARKLIFPCHRSRRDVTEAAVAPHEGGESHGHDEPIYPIAFRPSVDAPLLPLGTSVTENWRLRVPEGSVITFNDGCAGMQTAVAGVDFGDFLVWRKDDTPSYQLATVVDDIDFGVSEVVRGADLIKSTFRQLLLYQALQEIPPAFYHCPLVRDETGVRLAKRHDSLSVRALRAEGYSPSDVLNWPSGGSSRNAGHSTIGDST